jgi:hypothetical protein
LIRPGSAELRQLFATFERSAFRLETLQSYGQSGEDAAFDAFLAGQPYVRPPGKERWLSNIARARAAGATMSRVHIVREPLTAYMRFELTWAYAPNVDAGEHIAIIAVDDSTPWPKPFPQDYDFWLLDDHLYEMEYASDAARSWIGVHPVDDQDRTRIHRARVWRDVALDVAVPWRTYIESRPELAAIVAAMS